MVKRARMADYLTPTGDVDVVALRNAPAGLVRGYRRVVTHIPLKNGDLMTRESGLLDLESAAWATRELICCHLGPNRLQEGVGAEKLLQALQAMPDAAVIGLLRGLRAAGARDVTPATPRLTGLVAGCSASNCGHVRSYVPQHLLAGVQRVQVRSKSSDDSPPHTCFADER